ncbi:hypothetical protein ROS1_31080 [Roseibium sp. ROS1]
MSNEPTPTTPEVTLSPARSALRTNFTAESDNETMQWLDKFTEEMTQPGENEVAFFARRRELKLGAGLDDCTPVQSDNSG